ncbi:MAG: aldo/keto reductase [Oscillospiraceae bacterium]|jgi:predicted oxidoreductase|nr:aldo/keto reductase [Oscillospiraceae bacterium]
MKTIKLGRSDLQVPVVAVGCMRIQGLSPSEAERFVRTSLELGANFFDHADIYGGGVCEEIFARAVSMSPGVRETLILQSKCGIVPGRMYDFSKEHILRSVDGSLKRLKTDYLDVLLLHRPDALVEPEEVAEAFEVLHGAGKVRHFGVSNQNPAQMALLQKFLSRPIVTNQLQLSVAFATMISQGILVNTLDDGAVDRDGGVLDYCRLHDVTVQPWSPFQYGTFAGVFLDNDKYPALNAKIDELAVAYGVSNTTIAVAWLLRHPARMQPVIGTMNVQRLRDCVRAADVTLTREEWYQIYLAAGNELP